MFRLLVAAGCVIAGVGFLVTGSLQQSHAAWSLLLPLASVACIALLWE